MLAPDGVSCLIPKTKFHKGIAVMVGVAFVNQWGLAGVRHHFSGENISETPEIDLVQPTRPVDFR